MASTNKVKTKKGNWKGKSGRKESPDKKLHVNSYVLTSQIETITGIKGLTPKNLTSSGAHAKMQAFIYQKIEEEFKKKKAHENTNPSTTVA